MNNSAQSSTNAQPLAVNNGLLSYLTQCTNPNDNAKPSANIFPTLIETKSYVPISGCVLAHILTTKNLTTHEKLYYLLADGLAVINANNGKPRVATLPSEDWAQRLNCSRSLVFTMQRRLHKKGYFMVKKDWNKGGCNNRNLITSTLPDEIFKHLQENYPNKFGKHAPYNPLTEGKREYLDRTKLFIKLNYHLLQMVGAEQDTTGWQKIVWLGLYERGYKNYIRHGQENGDDSSFSFTVTYQELAMQYSCSTKYLSKALKSLERGGFIQMENFYIRQPHSASVHVEDMTDDYAQMQARQDYSVWKITLTLPTDYLRQLASVNNRANLAIADVSVLPQEHQSNTLMVGDCLIVAGVKFALTTEQAVALKSLITSNEHKDDEDDEQNDDVAKSDPSVAKSGLLLNKDLKLNIKNKDKKDAKLNFLKIASTKENPAIVLSEFNKNYVEKQINTEFNHSGQSLPPTETNASKPTKATTPVTIKATGRGLKTFHPLNELQVDKLNQQSGRSFNVNFANELLLKLARRYPGKTFLSNNHMISYMSKVFRHELHQATLVNNPSFRFAVNHPASQETAKIEQYLAEVEYSRDLGQSAQLRRKIAGIFTPSIAYQLLTITTFDYSKQITDLEEGLGEGGCLVQEIQQPITSLCGTIELGGDGSNDADLAQLTTLAELELMESELVDQAEMVMNVQLPPNVILSSHQQQSLTKAIEAVYGLVWVVYQQGNNLPELVESKNHATSQHQLVGTTTSLFVQQPIVPSLNPSLGDGIVLEDALASSPWQQIRWQLKQILGEEIEQAWLAKLTADNDLSTGTLILHAPSNFIRDWVTNHYSQQINEACQNLLSVKFCTIKTGN